MSSTEQYIILKKVKVGKTGILFSVSSLYADYYDSVLTGKPVQRVHTIDP